MRSAPCLVRAKTSVRPVTFERSTRARTARFSDCGTNMTLCSTRSTVVASGTTATRSGLRRSAAARPAISFGMVAEKNRLWRCTRQFAGDAADGNDEAQVEHVVGFVEHEDFGLVEADEAAGEQVEQAAGGGDHDFDAAGQGLDLFAFRHAAENDGDADVGVAAVGAETLGDLAGELARGGQHQNAAGEAGPGGAGFPAGGAGSAGRTRRSCRCRSGRCRAGRRRASRAEWPGSEWGWASHSQSGQARPEAARPGRARKIRS